ncbi:hypothetical protein F5Y18DRAFT_438318 [Xylariaceae sp. FL1019]|nr:hypothetical protein F5Y18DRAFT_438318 [Xylariaceae sp. FL1019]
MHSKHILSLTILSFTSTSAFPFSPQSVPSLSFPQPKQNLTRQTCTPSPITLTSIYYLEYLTSPYTPSPPNTTELAFTLSYPDPAIITGCAAQRVQIQGIWANDSEYWYACTDRDLSSTTALVPESKREVNEHTSNKPNKLVDANDLINPTKRKDINDAWTLQTHVKISWDTWGITLNQTWQCEQGWGFPFLVVKSLNIVQLQLSSKATVHQTLQKPVTSLTTLPQNLREPVLNACTGTHMHREPD